MSIDLSNPATAFLLIYWSAGLVLLVMRMLDGRAGAPSFLKALLLLLIPSVGWGVWRHDVRQTRSDGPHAPAAVPILGSMGTLHAIVLGLETILVATLWSGVGRDLLVDVGDHEQTTNATGEVLMIGTELAMNAFVGMGTLLAIAFLVLLNGIVFLVLSVLPWMMSGIIARSYAETRLHVLQSRLKDTG